MRPRDLPSAATLAERHPHGVRIRYVGGCRCRHCKAANTAYQAQRAKAKRDGESNGIVSATAARQHIIAMGHKGVGYKTVADAAKVSRTIIAGVMTGKRLRIRAMSARRILQVGLESLPDSALVSAKGAWRLIDLLLEEGYTRADIARRMGYKSPALQFRKDKITVKTRAAVKRIYFKLTK